MAGMRRSACGGSTIADATEERGCWFTVRRSKTNQDRKHDAPADRVVLLWKRGWRLAAEPKLLMSWCRLWRSGIRRCCKVSSRPR